MENEKPVKTIRRIGSGIAASIWLRRGRNGVFYEMTLSRSYPVGDEEFGYTSCFRQQHADDLAAVAQEAAEWIRTTCAGAETVVLGHEAA